MRQRVSAFIGAYRRHRFGWLFATLLVTLPVGPLVSPLTRFNLLEFLLAVNLLAAIASAARDRWFCGLLAFGGFYLVARTLAVFDIPVLLRASEAFWLVTTILATAATARRALLDEEVDSEH